MALHEIVAIGLFHFFLYVFLESCRATIFWVIVDSVGKSQQHTHFCYCWKVNGFLVCDAIIYCSFLSGIFAKRVFRDFSAIDSLSRYRIDSQIAIETFAEKLDFQLRALFPLFQWQLTIPLHFIWLDFWPRRFFVDWWKSAIGGIDSVQKWQKGISFRVFWLLKNISHFLFR